MFVREKKTPLSNKTAIQLVESVRQRGRVKQKIVRHFGYAINEDEIKSLKDLALKYKLELETKTQPVLFETGRMMEIIASAPQKEDDNKPLPVNLKHIVEEKRIRTGIHLLDCWAER